MKKALGIVMLLMFAAPIMAQEDNSGGVAPDSFLYGLDVALDDINYLMTFDNSEKVKVGLEIADERLQEVKQMILKNKLEESKQAQREHERMLNRVRENTGTFRQSGSSDDIVRLAEAETEIEEHGKKIETVEGELKVKIKIKGDITTEQQGVIDSILDALKNQTGEVKIKVNADKDELKISIRTENEKKVEKDDDVKDKKDEVNDDEDDDDVNDNDDDEKENKGKGNSAEKAADQIEDAMERIARAKALVANRTNVPSDVMDLIANAEKHLAKAKEAFDDKKFGEAFGQANAAASNARNAIKILQGIPGIPHGSIEGMKFNDLDGDGIKDANETGLQNWTITLSGKENRTAVTDANGNYAFSNLTLGNYTVSETVKSGWILTTPNFVSVSITNTTTVVNFGNFQLGQISGAKFEDKNGNGIKDTNDTGLANWTIKLAGSVNATATTDTNGAYSFANLTAGAYTITETSQSGWVQTKVSSPVTVQSGTNSQNNDLGNFQLGQISVLVFSDENNNTVQDGNETGLAGWTVNLSGTSNASVVTNANGTALFANLAASTYTVTQVVQANWTQTTVNPAAIQIMSGTSASVSFGNFLQS